MVLSFSPGELKHANLSFVILEILSSSVTLYWAGLYKITGGGRGKCHYNRCTSKQTRNEEFIKTWKWIQWRIDGHGSRKPIKLNIQPAVNVLLTDRRGEKGCGIHTLIHTKCWRFRNLMKQAINQASIQIFGHIIENITLNCKVSHIYLRLKVVSGEEGRCRGLPLREL